MNKRPLHRSPLHLSFGSLLAASLLAACGGGGGGEPAPAPPPAPAPAPTPNLELGGVAAKGLMANADVTVHPVKDGQIDEATVLASATTNASGTYTLQFSSTAGNVYALRLRAKADGSTTHKDEFSGSTQPLPAGFTMRALLTAQSGVTKTDVFITPFSEMATAAAAKAGISKTNAEQAQSNVIQLLGFDPGKVKPTDLASASSDDEKKLAVMLTSVSKLASAGELGCSAAATAGDKARCVVEKLAESSRIDSTKPGTVAGVDVAARLLTAVGSVLNDPAINKGLVDPAALTVAMSNLQGDGKPAPISSSEDVTAAKTLFTELRSNLTTLLMPAQGASTSPLEAETLKFEAAVAGVEQPVDMLLKDATAIVGGVQLLLDYTRRGSNLVSRGGYFDMLPGAPGAAGLGCSLYQDADRTLLATSPANAKHVGCSARYGAMLYSDPNQGGKWVWAYTRHRVFVDVLSDTEYRYSTTARTVVCKTSASICSPIDAFAQYCPQSEPASDFSGTLSIGHQQYRLTSFDLQGDLPAMFKKGSSALYNPGGKSVVALKASRNALFAETARAGDLETVNLEGKISLYSDNGSTLDSALEIKPGSKMVNQVIDNGSVARAPVTMTLNLQASTPAAEIEGLFSVSDLVTDSSGIETTPSKLALKGMLRNKSASALSEFISGEIGIELQGFANYNASLPQGANNSYKLGLTFGGSVSAPERPLLSLSLSFKRSLAEALRDGVLTGQFKTVVAGVPKVVLALDGSESTDPAQRSRLRVSEASSGINFRTDGMSDLIDLMRGEVKIGLIDLVNGRITFTNGEFISLK